MKRAAVPGMVVLAAALAFLAVVAFAKLLTAAYDAKDLRQRFEGACAVLGGEVHGSVCVKDRVVVLTKSEYAEKEKAR